MSDSQNLEQQNHEQLEAVPQNATKVRFDQIWQQIQKHNAVLFLRHALRIDMTLEQVLQALSYQNTGDQVANLRLADVLLPQQQRDAAAAATQSPAPSKDDATRTRRKRRGPEEIHKLREQVLERMRAAMGSVTTSHLCDVLNNGGFEVDLLQMNRLLVGLEQDGYLMCLGGKPKNWRLKPQGRTAPEPMVVVRRAPSSS